MDISSTPQDDEFESVFGIVIVLLDQSAGYPCSCVRQTKTLENHQLSIPTAAGNYFDVSIILLRCL